MVPAIDAPLARDLDGEDVAALGADVEHAVGEDRRANRTSAASGRDGRASAAALGVDLDQAAVGGADPGVAVASTTGTA